VSRFRDIDGCPVPVEIADEIIAIKARSGATLVSCYRGSDPDARKILRKHGKKTQRELWRESQQPGSSIRANPPGYSTHELFNDGVAYSSRRGAKLKPWQVGQDWDIPHVRAVVGAASSLGFIATVTYPNSSYERQHVNFRKEPKLKIFRSLKRGQRSPRVSVIRKNLAYVLDPQSRKPYLHSANRLNGSNSYFDDTLYHALREFQRDHGLEDDGVYGYRTAKQLAASVRFRNSKEKK